MGFGRTLRSLQKALLLSRGPRARSALVSMSTNRSQPCCHAPHQSSHAKCEHKGSRNDRNLSDCSVLLAPLLRNEKFGRAYVVLSYVPRGRGGYVAPFSGVISQIKIKATTSSNLRKGRRLHFFILYHLATYYHALLQMHSCIRVNERKGEWYGAYGGDWD